MVNRAANGGGGGGNNDNNNNNADTTGSTAGDTTGQTAGDNTAAQRRSPFQRNVLDDLQMNTGRTVRISPDVVPRLSKRLSIAARRAGATANQEVEALTKKRFVVDWQGVDPTGSDE
jgi:syntaxin 1B/2/3